MNRRHMLRVLLASTLAATLVAGCGSDAGTPDAGRDAMGELALTVTGNITGVRSVRVTLSVTNYMRTDTFPVAGLPSTVMLAHPVQLGTWSISVDALDMSSQLVGRGTVDVAAGTTEASVAVAPI